MRLEGSCHCRAVQFSLESHTPAPFMRCHCSICRKTAGSGGYAINLGGDAATLTVSGQEHVAIYHAVMREGGGRETRSPAGRHFCRLCGSALWLWDPRWPELVHPHASAIDTALPTPPEVVEIGLAWAPSWIDGARAAEHVRFEHMPSESLEDWHKRHGLWSA